MLILGAAFRQELAVYSLYRPRYVIINVFLGTKAVLTRTLQVTENIPLEIMMSLYNRKVASSGLRTCDICHEGMVP